MVFSQKFFKKNMGIWAIAPPPTLFGSAHRYTLYFVYFGCTFFVSYILVYTLSRTFWCTHSICIPQCIYYVLYTTLTIADSFIYYYVVYTCMSRTLYSVGTINHCRTINNSYTIPYLFTPNMLSKIDFNTNILKNTQ